MLITVTEKHIADGTPKKSRFCPIALALQETVGTEKVSVGNYTCSWHESDGFGNDTHYCSVLPIEAENFVKGFDAGNKMKPFSFEVFPWK